MAFQNSGTVVGIRISRSIVDLPRATLYGSRGAADFLADVRGKGASRETDCTRAAPQSEGGGGDGSIGAHYETQAGVVPEAKTCPFVPRGGEGQGDDRPEDLCLGGSLLREILWFILTRESFDRPYERCCRWEDEAEVGGMVFEPVKNRSNSLVHFGGCPALYVCTVIDWFQFIIRISVTPVAVRVWANEIGEKKNKSKNPEGRRVLDRLDWWSDRSVFVPFPPAGIITLFQCMRSVTTLEII